MSIYPNSPLSYPNAPLSYPYTPGDPVLNFTVTPEPAHYPPRVRIDVSDPRPIPITSMTITRQDPDGRTVNVRTADDQPLPVSGGVATLFDYEPPFGDEVIYYTSAYSEPVAKVTLDVPDVWLIHPGVPSRSVPVLLAKGALDEETWDIDRGLFTVLGRSAPMVITAGARVAPASTLRLLTRTTVEVDALRLLLADGAPLLLNIPAGKSAGITHNYISVGAVRMARGPGVLSDPYRTVELPYQVVDRPSGGSQSTITWDTESAKYATWQAIADAGVASWDAFADPTE